MPTTKTKTIYLCQNCGAVAHKWMGQCAECKAWNSLVEEVVASGGSAHDSGYAKDGIAKITALADVEIADIPRVSTGILELDRVLGGGLVQGSVVLVGGDPGIGKSTLLLQALCYLCKSTPVLYVSGEESLEQIALRAQRLNLASCNLKLLSETQVEQIIALAEQENPKVIVVDSVQTLFTQALQSAPGSIGQVRESAARLVRYAKQTGVALFIIGHVTKEGTIAGPRILEHMVDCVLYFEGSSDSRYRVIRATKNRFGAVNELGVFAMTDQGLREVTNPSALFLSSYSSRVTGSAVMATWEGSRPLLVEVQALVNTSYLTNPRRLSVGLDQNRLSMLLAVLHKHGGIKTYDQDVFVNVVGGVRVVETAGDLAIMLAVLSSLRNRPLQEGLMVFGEVGLGGEIRPVQSGQERLKAAVKHGFKRALVPKANAPKKGQSMDLEIIAVSNLLEALQIARD